jgi:LCP family protein required for cell wall assembly
MLAGLGVAMLLPANETGVLDNGEKERDIAGLLENLSNVSGEPRNILVLGVDRRPEGSEVEGARADALALVRVYPGSGEVRVVSIPRDLLVEVAPGVEDKINAAYSYGGAPDTVEAVERYAGIYVDHYLVADFAGFEAFVDAIGGVKVDVDESVVPSNWKVTDGPQRLNGRKALLYTRYRSSSGGDLDRIRRQQEVLAALRSQAFRWRSVEKFPEIIRAVTDNVETDMSVSEMAALGRTVGQHGRNSVMTSTQLKGSPGTLENGSEVLVPDEEANEAVLREFRD